MKYKTRRRLSLFFLLLGLPFYIALVITGLSFLPRQSVFVEFVIYVILGVVWAFPLKYIFRGIGQFDNSQNNED
ncbi:MAG: DUF2842 domain-containing protein [Paracoccaceae bacterium]